MCSGYFHSLEYLKIRDTALDDLSAVYGASVSVLASTDNLTLVKKGSNVSQHICVFYDVARNVSCYTCKHLHK